MLLHKSEEYRVLVSNFDYLERLTCFSILDYFQQISRVHSDIMNIGYKKLKQSNLAFVITKTKFKIFNNPTSTSCKLKIETYPLKPELISFYRAYKIWENETLLVEGMQEFVLIDTNSFRIKRSNTLNYKGEHLNTFSNYQISKIDYKNIDFIYKYTYIVKNSDLDQNKHLNNANYIRISLDCLNNLDYQFEEITINYINQAFLNDKIDIYFYEEEKRLTFLGKDDTKVYYVIKIDLKEM